MITEDTGKNHNPRNENNTYEAVKEPTSRFW